MSTALEVVPNEAALGFSDPNRFEHIQRVATMFSKSQLVPLAFQNNINNCVIALEMAMRINASPLMLMQNLHIIHGKPSFGSSFLIASINSSKRFTPLRFNYVGTKGHSDRGCYAFAKSIADGEECTGVTVTMEIAETEGWTKKNGSKWKTMPDLMLMYRAATWWCRMYAPETTMGFQTQEEVIDLIDPDDIPEAGQPQQRKARGSKGISAAVKVTPEEPATETPPATEPAAKMPEATAQPSAAPTTTDEPKVKPETAAEGEEGKKGTVKARCEIVTVTQKNGRKDGAVVPVCEIQIKGEATGIAFYDGPAAEFPSDGSLLDLTLEIKPYKGGTAYVIKGYDLIGG